MKHNKKLEENIRKYEDAKAKGENLYLDINDLVDITEYYNDNGDVEKSMEMTDYMIKLFPGATLPLCFRARQALLDKDTAKAELFADMIDDKSDTEYMFLLAEIEITKGNVDKAEEIMQDAYDRETDDNKDDLATEIAEMFFEYEQDNLCNQWLNRCGNRQTKSYMEMMSKLAIANGRISQGKKLLDHLLDKDPFSIQYWNQMASAQYMLGSIPESLTSSDYALAIDENNADALLHKANCLNMLENYEEAEKYYKRYILLKPNVETGYMFLGLCYSHMEKFDDAIPMLNKAVDVCSPNSNNLEAILQELCFCYVQKKQIEKAMECICQAERLPNHSKADLEFLRSICHLANNKITQSLVAFDSALSLAGNDETKTQYYIQYTSMCIDNDFRLVAYTLLNYFLFEEGGEKQDQGWAYYALSCALLNKRKEYEDMLKIACERNPEETKLVFGNLFPAGTPVEEYPLYSNSLFT